MPSPEELELGGSSIEYLAMGGIPEILPTALCNVKFLCILDVFQKYNVDEVSSTGYVITSCAKLQEVTIECGVVGIAVEPVIYTIITSLINLVWCCKAASKCGDALYYWF
ncbi:uncharacterized protein LOC107027819 [Solanum pennellii]|uniref:Uncharacterized protein LOC107027819 n=1 Tax=Solanum pennellii TaxID=28526 RepID=A0ABM1VFW7_SOLPN|nr:uncharacterized protein LOC107027819 [Solanum pennellii]XP_027774635.1 uncharacterized protein LOC107027819 [Solanum pennellii]